MSCLVIGLFFLRFWRKSGDRLFLYFTIAFWLLGINWLALEILNIEELRTPIYAVRLVAFTVILTGILDKNRAQRAGRARFGVGNSNK